MGGINYDLPFIFNPANGGASLPLSFEITDGQTIASRRCYPNINEEFTVGYHWEETIYGTYLVTNEEVCAFKERSHSYIRSLFEISTWESKESFEQWMSQTSIPVVVPEIVPIVGTETSTALRYYLHDNEYVPGTGGGLQDFPWQTCLKEVGEEQYEVAAPREYEVVDFTDSTVTLMGIDAPADKNSRYILSKTTPSYRTRENYQYSLRAPFKMNTTYPSRLPSDTVVDFQLYSSFFPIYLKHGLKEPFEVYPDRVVKPRAILRSYSDIELKKGTLLYPDRLDVTTSAGRREYANLCYETVGFICFNDLTGAS